MLVISFPHSESFKFSRKIFQFLVEAHGLPAAEVFRFRIDPYRDAVQVYPLVILDQLGAARLSFHRHPVHSFIHNPQSRRPVLRIRYYFRFNLSQPEDLVRFFIQHIQVAADIFDHHVILRKAQRRHAFLRRSLFHGNPQFFNAVDPGKLFGLLVYPFRRGPGRDRVQIRQVGRHREILRVYIQFFIRRTRGIAERQSPRLAAPRSPGSIDHRVGKRHDQLFHQVQVGVIGHKAVIVQAAQVAHILPAVAVFLRFQQETGVYPGQCGVVLYRFADGAEKLFGCFHHLPDPVQVDYRPAQERSGHIVRIVGVLDGGHIADAAAQPPAVLSGVIDQRLQPLIERGPRAGDHFLRSHHPVRRSAEGPRGLNAAHQAGIDHNRLQPDAAVCQRLFQFIQIHDVVIKQFIDKQPGLRAVAVAPQHQRVFLCRIVLSAPPDKIRQRLRRAHVPERKRVHQFQCLLIPVSVPVDRMIIVQSPPLQGVRGNIDADILFLRMPCPAAAGLDQDVDLSDVTHGAETVPY